MPRVLITRPMKLGAGGNELPIRRWIGSYLRQHLGYTVTYESEQQWQNWLDYDLVAPYFNTVYDATDRYHVHMRKQLGASMRAGQPRLVHDDDCYFKPLSLLRQLGLDDANEFTHRLVLHCDMRRSSHFNKFASIESLSVDNAARIESRQLWCYPPDLLTDFAEPSVASLRETRCFYAGYGKPDRIELLQRFDACLLRYGGKLRYLRYLAEASSSIANCMMNSVEHRNLPTPRLYESAALSVQLWPEGIKVDCYKPPDSRVFANNAELDRILTELGRQKPSQRINEITETAQAIREALRNV